MGLTETERDKEKRGARCRKPSFASRARDGDIEKCRISVGMGWNGESDTSALLILLPLCILSFSIVI